MNCLQTTCGRPRGGELMLERLGLGIIPTMLLAPAIALEDSAPCRGDRGKERSRCSMRKSSDSMAISREIPTGSKPRALNMR